MQISPSDHTASDNYKLLTNLVVPRPIAWVSSVSGEGLVNLAPFSFFNAVDNDPLLVMISVGKNSDGSLKDTASNIVATGDFVVNLVTEELMQAMNISAVDFPPDASEVTPAGLHTAKSMQVKSPRIAEAQASLECRLYRTVPLGNYTLYIGEVVLFHVADALMGERLHVNGFAPIGRLGSPSMYSRTTDRFELPRISYADWQKQR